MITIELCNEQCLKYNNISAIDCMKCKFNHGFNQETMSIDCSYINTVKRYVNKAFYDTYCYGTGCMHKGQGGIFSSLQNGIITMGCDWETCGEHCPFEHSSLYIKELNEG